LTHSLFMALLDFQIDRNPRRRQPRRCSWIAVSSRSAQIKFRRRPSPAAPLRRAQGSFEIGSAQRPGVDDRAGRGRRRPAPRQTLNRMARSSPTIGRAGLDLLAELGVRPDRDVGPDADSRQQDADREARWFANSGIVKRKQCYRVPIPPHGRQRSFTKLGGCRFMCRFVGRRHGDVGTAAEGVREAPRHEIAGMWQAR
jgi:hypothetical protein